MVLNESAIHVSLSTPPENDFIYLKSSPEAVTLDDRTHENGTKSSLEYFDELHFSIDALSIFTIIVYLIGLCIIIPGFTGIIWYEKYGNHRNRYVN